MVGKKQSCLGNALIKAKNKQKVAANAYFKQNKVEEVEKKPKVNLASVVERDTLAEFMYGAELAQKKFNVL